MTPKELRTAIEEGAALPPHAPEVSRVVARYRSACRDRGIVPDAAASAGVVGLLLADPEATAAASAAFALGGPSGLYALLSAWLAEASPVCSPTP